jgi:Putative adhesin
VDIPKFQGTFCGSASYHTAMKTKYALPLAALAVFSWLPSLAQDPDHSWSRTYPVSGTPTLTLETSDAGVEFHSCGDCHEIRIHIEVVGRKLSDYRLEEGQSGDQVHLTFKELPHMGVHMVWHKEQTRVTVESPAQLTLQAKTSDGNVTLSGLRGDLSLTTGDGNVDLDHVSGNLRIKSGDGRVKITNADGAINASTSDGNLSVDGLFHALALHTSDGTLDVSLREGTKLAGASTIQSSDGSVTIRVPQNFAADLDVHTSDGRVDCALPVTTDHYQSGGEESHELRGKVNGGGTPLTIHTSDGNVKIEYL